jgi:hypothetical protein
MISEQNKDAKARFLTRFCTLLRNSELMYRFWFRARIATPDGRDNFRSCGKVQISCEDGRTVPRRETSDRFAGFNGTTESRAL